MEDEIDTALLAVKKQCSAGKFIGGVASQCNLDEGHSGPHEYYKGVMGMRVN